MSRLSWLTTLPATVGGALLVVPEAVNGIRVLPDILERLDRIAETTEKLPELNETLKEVSEHTAALPEVRDQVAKVTRATVHMEQHTARILETIPSLAVLEQTLPAFATGLDELAVLLRDFEITVKRLNETVEPLGRLAGRFPSRRNAAKE